jgi:hypothetical protein
MLGSRSENVGKNAVIVKDTYTDFIVLIHRHYEKIDSYLRALAVMWLLCTIGFWLASLVVLMWVALIAAGVCVILGFVNNLISLDKIK